LVHLVILALLSLLRNLALAVRAEGFYLTSTDEVRSIEIPVANDSLNVVNYSLAAWRCCLFFLVCIGPAELVTLAVAQLTILIGSSALPSRYAAVLLPGLDELHLVFIWLCHGFHFRTLHMCPQILRASKVATVLRLHKILASPSWTFLQLICVDINRLSILITFPS
jgi:hypothetical protein